MSNKFISIRPLVIIALLCCSIGLFAQTKKVLFLGNSYTYVNDLPAMLSAAATSAGKSLVYDMYAPGGYYVYQHLLDVTALAKISDGNWDNVILQDQSMSMAYPNRYINWMPNYIELDSIIKADNLCVQTMLYSTWGRKNGDSYLCSLPDCETDTWIVRTYYEMDAAIEANYKSMADSLQASITPVGATWRHIRENYPAIELFDPDESHPSPAGTYAAACAFYATIFRSDPTAITFNGSIPAADALNIRNAAKQEVFEHLADWNVGVFDELLDDSCLNLAVSDHKPNGHFSVAPNPAKNILNIRFDEEGIKDILTIYNAYGVLVMEIEASNNITIDISGVQPGLYLITSINNKQVLKILKM